MANWKTHSLPLAYPITVGEGPDAKKIEAIVLREPDLEALEKLDEGGVLDGAGMSIKQVRLCLEAMSDVPAEAIRKMHASDAMKAAEALGPLLESLVPEASGGTKSKGCSR